MNYNFLIVLLMILAMNKILNNNNQKGLNYISIIVIFGLTFKCIQMRKSKRMSRFNV